MTYDKIIIGSGLCGVYAATKCGGKGERILLLEYDSEPFGRATYINQARIHKGYHYPRSLRTAVNSAGYFNRFIEDFPFCIHADFSKIYAMSTSFSWTNAEAFSKFCSDAGIECESVNPEKYFQSGMCDGAFLTSEVTYDANILKEHFLHEIEKLPNIDVKYYARIRAIRQHSSHFEITMENGDCYSSDYILNASYASANQIISMLGYEMFNIKYELCEIILCEVADELRELGITVMDGPFFSIMPFGMTGLHSLTSVTYTPHYTSYEHLPKFECQSRSGGYCSPAQLGNCNTCTAKPETAWQYMSHLAKKYLREELDFSYKGSLFSMKPILKNSEVNDSRPTLIKKHSDFPAFISVFSGKITTIYDLDSILYLNV